MSRPTGLVVLAETRLLERLREGQDGKLKPIGWDRARIPLDIDRTDDAMDPVILFIVHWLLVPISTLGIARVAFGRYSYLPFPTVFLGSHFIFIHFGALGIYHTQIRNPMFLASVWVTPILFLLSSILTMLVLRHSATKARTAFFTARTRVSDRDVDLAALTRVISPLALVLPVILILDRGISDIALFHLLANPGNAVETMNLRIGGLSSSYSSVLTGVYSYARALFYPAYMSILVALQQKKLVSTPHLVIVFIASAFYVSLTTAKAPLAVLLVSMLVSYYAAGTRVRSRAIVLLYGVLALLVSSSVYPLLYGAQGIEFLEVAWESLWRRITWVPSYVAAVYYDVFPQMFDHLGFSSNRFLAFLAGVDYIPTAALVYDHYYQGSIAGGLMNASYFASFYADWGMPGVIGGAIFLGVMIAGLQVYFDKQADAVAAGMRAAVLTAVVQLHLTNFYSVGLGRGLLSLPLILAVGAPVLRILLHPKRNRANAVSAARV